MVGGGASDIDDDAQPAFASAADASGLANAFDGGGDEDGPPLDVLEAQMRSELATRGASGSPALPRAPARRAAAEDDDGDATPGGGRGAPLPELDTLVARLPAEVRGALDELFRARFVSVKKLPKNVFQTSSAKAPPTAT